MEERVLKKFTLARPSNGIKAEPGRDNRGCWL
jgi:hypothetical protein